MRWLWITVFFTVLFWLRSLPVFTPVSEDWVLLVIPAILAAGAGLRRAAVREFDIRWLLALVPLALAVWQLPFPFNLPPLLCALALVLVATVRFSSGLAWVGLPVGLVGLMLLVQAAVFPLLYIISSRVHELPFLAPFFYRLVKVFDPGAALSEHKILVHYVYDVFEFPVRLEALGFIQFCLFALGGGVLLAVRRRSARAHAGLAGLLAGYAVLRYLFLVFLEAKYQSAGAFWLPHALALSLAPLVLIVIAIPGMNRSGSKACEGEAGGETFGLSWPRPKRALLALGLAAVAALGITGMFAYHDPGARKQGRILIDELHSDWEWTTQVYDTEWYGRKSGYNYYCLAEYLNHFYHVEASRDSLLLELLAGFDVVMLKTPTSPYSAREVEALVDFVRRGGGLWLIGDHTNVFGTSTYLNRLAGRFGLRLRYDSTYDLETLALSLFRAPPVFRHPVVAHLPLFLFATSCTMEAPFLSENMIVGYSLKAAPLDYARTSFFPRKDNQNYNFGVLLQQGGVKYGKGRVAIFTDSTCFSNFFMFMTGKPELVLGTVEWLNRTNRFAWLNAVLLTIGLLGLAGFAVLARRWRWHRGRILAVMLPGAFLGMGLAVPVYDGNVAISYPPPEPHTAYVHVAFETEHSEMELPTVRLTTEPDLSLHTFFVWTQRLGLFPSVEATLESALAKGDLVVIANPVGTFGAGELRGVADFVDRGGRLLVLVDPANRSEAQRQLLESLGVCDTLPSGSGAAEDTLTAYIVSLEGRSITPAARPRGLVCDHPLLNLSTGGAVLAEARSGKGRVFVFSDFYLFTDRHMGHTGEPVDPARRRIFELEYWMIRKILDITQPPPFWEQ